MAPLFFSIGVNHMIIHEPNIRMSDVAELCFKLRPEDIDEFDRRTDLTSLQRLALRLHMKMQYVNVRYGNTYSTKGKLIDVGIAHATFVYADPLDNSKGLAKTSKPMRLYPICQDVVRAGQLMGVNTDMTVSQFLELPENAVTYKDLISRVRGYK